MTAEQKALRLAVAVLLIGPGALTALDFVFWPVDGLQDASAEATRLLFAILGGITAGWGVMMWCLAGEPLARDPDLVRPILRTSLLAWFVLDSTGSVLAGAPFNAVLNVLILAAFLFPLWSRSRQPAPR
jgi:hypothetical protein